MAITKEDIIEPLKQMLEALPESDLKDNEISVLCLVSDTDGIGEIMMGNGGIIMASIAHAISDNEALYAMVKTAIDVVDKYKEEQNAYVKLAEMADKKYKS